MPYVEVDVDLDDFDDQDLIDELEYRGWIVGDEKGQVPLIFSDEEKDYIANLLINERTGIGREIYDKVKK